MRRNPEMPTCWIGTLAPWMASCAASIMSGNVFFIIMPNQRVVVADLKAGRTPDPKYGKIAKQRSTHNNYLTLPVLFLHGTADAVVPHTMSDELYVAARSVPLSGLVGPFERALQDGECFVGTDSGAVEDGGGRYEDGHGS